MLVSIFPGILTFVLTVVGIPAFIRFYRKAQITGQQMHEGCETASSKSWNTNNGWNCFPYSRCFSQLYLCTFNKSIDQQCRDDSLHLATIWFGWLLRWFLKVFRKINEGLNPKQKFLLQLVGGVIFYLFYERGGDVLNVFGYPLHLGVLYIFFALFWLVGFSNAVNLTDGIDGLASISVVISLSAMESLLCTNNGYFS